MKWKNKLPLLYQVRKFDAFLNCPWIAKRLRDAVVTYYMLYNTFFYTPLVFVLVPQKDFSQPANFGPQHVLGHPPPTSPGHPLKILFDHFVDVLI